MAGSTRQLKFAKLIQKEISDILQLQLSDTRKAVLFRADLSNERIPAANDKPHASQEAIYNYVKGLQ